jgi:LPS O-antigen subunit length determinant protein (WzzB/FepE family)
MLRTLLTIILLLVLTACGQKEPVIGVQTLDDGVGEKAEVRLHYFESKDEALDYYHEKGLIDFVLMVHENQDEKEVYNQIEADSEDKGTKTVSFTSENPAEPAEDLAFAYLYEKLGLTINCVYNGKECK